MQYWRAITIVIVAGCGGNMTTKESSSLPTIEQERTEDSRIVLAPIVLTTSEEVQEPRHLESGHTQVHMKQVVTSYRPMLIACTAASALGSLQLYMEIDEQGLVVGASTEPTPGQDGVSAAAGCVLRAARSWQFPKRSLRGSTILIVPFVWNDHSVR